MASANTLAESPDSVISLFLNYGAKQGHTWSKNREINTQYGARSYSLVKYGHVCIKTV